MMILMVVFILPVIAFFLFKKSSENLYPPSPPGLPVIGNLLQFDSSNPHLYLFKLAQKYGPILSIKLGKRRVVVFSSAEMAKEVLQTHDLNFSNRPSFKALKKLSYNELDVSVSPYGDVWRELRKIVVLNLLSNKQVKSFRPIREDEVGRMISRIATANDYSQTVNLFEIIINFTSSLIIRTAFGKKYEDGQSRMQRFNKLMIDNQAVMAGFFVSDYLPAMSWIDRLSGMTTKLDNTFKELDEFFQELIDEDRSESFYPNILDILIQIKEKNLSFINLTWDHVKALLFDIFVGGTDTSAAVIVWAMTALIKRPDAMKRLQMEIREKVGKKGSVNEDDIHNLPYLTAVIKETFRLYPAIPLLVPRESIQDCVIKGYKIPAKTMVYINEWAIARDPTTWENPNDFLPERFLNSSIDIVGKHFEVIPFGSGRRVCPGISLGIATIELALANLVYTFDWELPIGMKKEDIDTDLLPGITMHKKNPLFLVPRNSAFISI